MNFKFFSLITGSAGLLGKHHARGLLNLKKNLILTDINLNKCIEISKKLKKEYPDQQILCFKLDVTSEKSVKNLIKKLRNKKIIVSVLINNAAVDAKFTKGKKNNDFRLESFSLKKWLLEINVGLTGAMICSKHFGSLMSKYCKKGIILNIASDLSVISPNQAIYKVKGVTSNKQSVKPITYSVIKHGIIGLTKYLATYWPRKNVRCNALSPGSVLNRQPSKLVRELKKMIPLNRLAKENEYTAAIEFLCSDKSSYMTGQNIIIDGGRSIW